jgi:hypothetical protein
MAREKGSIVTLGALDGRNGADPPISLPENQAVEMLNVDRHDGLIGRKRGGADAVTETGGTAFSSGIQSLFRHVPGADETAAELWGIDGAATPIVKRMAAGTSFANVTLDDAIATKPQEVTAASLNGKLILAYDSTVDRLHVYDPKLASPRVRRAGLPASAIAPSVANSGSGSYSATLRYYRVRWLQLNYTRAQTQESVNTADALRAASGNQRLAQGFQLSTAGRVLTFEATMAKTGTAPGSVYVTIESDSSGSPSGTVLQTSNSVAFNAISDSTTTYTRFTFSSPVELSASTQYHIVMYGTYPVDASNFAHWRGTTSNAYANGSAKDYDGANWTAATNSLDFVFRLCVATDGTTAPLIYRRSEPSPSQSFTPSGSGTKVVVTQPTVPGEGETHWELEESTDNGTWYQLCGFERGNEIAIATTTADHESNPSSDILTLSQTPAAAGAHTVFPSAKYLLTDGNRLLGAGAWETSGANSGGKQSRVWFTPVLGSTDKGDDERVPNQTTQKNWVDINENDGGGITGLGGPIYGAPYAFKYRQVWKLNPTGEIAAPYLPRKIADGVYGAIGHKTIVVAKDRQGNPALYFLGPEGPCRIVIYEGSATPQYLGRDVEDIWSGINLAASTVVAHGIYHPDKHQVWFWIATGSSNDPDTKLVFDVLLGRFTEGERIRGGWFKHTGPSAGARCSTLFSNTLAASMSRDLKPYIGRASGTAIWKLDTSTTNDAGTNVQAEITSRPIPIAPLGAKVGMGQSTLLAKAASGVTITQTLNRDFGAETRTSTVLLTPNASETRVIKKFEASEMAQADTIQVTLGDAAAASNSWTLDQWTAPVHTEGAK